MTSKELRQKYLDFFSSKRHAILPSASLIPENDPTTLFTTAGMHPLVPFLMGETHPEGKRLANCQKCIRTSDIDEVGDAVHHTFFEMLGNWSLGDYFKKEAIEMSWEFLTSSNWLKLDENRIAIAVFAGDEDAPFDEESFAAWRKLGVSAKRIAKLPKKDNWWGPAGETGPCGPDTAMFYWAGDQNNAPEEFTPEDKKWVEIWNDVFMEYDKNKDGGYKLLKQKNVDTGMGLERTLAVLNGLGDNYKTELFINLINKVERLSGKKYDSGDNIKRAMRIVVDHIKAATFVMADEKGIMPSNTDQGYIVRRLIRRAIRYGKQLGIKEKSWTKEIAKIVAHDYAEVYPEVQKNIEFVIKQMKEEEDKFSKTLESGMKIFNKWYKMEIFWEGKRTSETGKIIPGKYVFDLYQTYGFPIELTKEIAKENNLEIDEEGFKKELEKHQELSRTASAGKFKGGLADASEETKKLHTAAHLLLAALRKVLGDHVVQKGSNITAERLRFDFSHSEKMTKEQKQEVEKLVNEVIERNLPVSYEEMTVEEAKEKGAMGVFESKYGEKVKVYKIGQNNKVFSYEICGGPHVENTGILGKFKIKKEQSSSAGVRRIKAVLE